MPVALQRAKIDIFRLARNSPTVTRIIYRVDDRASRLYRRSCDLELSRRSAEGSEVTFGEYLRALRQARDLNKNRFAAQLGVPFNTVNGWELHGATPNKKNLSAIFDLLALDPSEKKKLTDLWLAIPNRRGKKGGVRPTAEEPPAPSEPAGDARRNLESLLTAALVPGRHNISDGMAVLAALAEAASFIAEAGVSQAGARGWLDAAAMLRERKIKVTAPMLAAALAAPRPTPKNSQALEPSERVSEKANKTLER